MSIRKTLASGADEIVVGLRYENLRQHFHENIQPNHALATDANKRASWYFDRLQDIAQ